MRLCTGKAAFCVAVFGFGFAPAASAQLEEIVVTAQKREQSVNDVGITINTFAGAQVEELGVETLIDIAAYTPGMSASTGLAGAMPVFTIRGVGLSDFAANNTGPVAVYVDDVAPVSAFMQMFQLFDVERVEVLKGPQGTLYGRNATGGAINFVSRKPGEELGGYAELKYDSLYEAELSAAVDIPLSDNVRSRIATNYVYGVKDGWQKGLNGSADAADANIWALRALLDVDISDTASMLINVHGGADNGVAATWLGSPVPAAAGGPLTGLDLSVSPIDGSIHPPSQVLRVWSGSFDPATADLGTAFSEGFNRGDSDITAFGASVRFDVETGLGDFTSITAYEDVDRFSVDFDSSAENISDFLLDNRFTQFSQEFRLSGETDRINWTTGLFYGTDEIEMADRFDITSFVDFIYWTFAPDLRPTALGVKTELPIFATQKTDAYGIFGHVEWALSDTVNLTTAVRYSEQERKADGFQEADEAGLFQALIGTGTIVTQYDNEKRTEDRVTWRLGLDWAINDDVLAYVSAATGFKSGIFYISGATHPQTWGYVEPEDLTAYEVGIKATLADGRAQVNGAYYFYDYEDRQEGLNVIDPNLPTTDFPTLGNVTKSESQGLELEASYLPTDNWRLQAGAAWINAEVKELPDNVRGLLFSSADFGPGSKLAYSPDFSWFVMSNYTAEFGSDLEGVFSLNYSNADPYSPATGSPRMADRLEYLDLSFTLQKAAETGWAVSLYGRNLQDNDGYKELGTTLLESDLAQKQKPREYGIRFRYEF